jgi:protein TonB
MRETARSDFHWQPPVWQEAGRYAFAAAIVLAVAGGSVAFLGSRAPEGQAASETDEAVLLDLPPEPPSPAPRHDAADGPVQEATGAAPPVPPVEAPPPQLEQHEDQPPVAEKGDLPQEGPRAAVTPPPPQPAAPAQEEMAPASSAAPVTDAGALDSEAARHRAAVVLALWQKAMAIRLQAAKAGMHTGGLAGTVEIAFAIDRKGALLSRHIARSSGSLVLDQAALALLARAAPFPAPPPGTDDEALRFTVPVVFSHKR